MAGGDPSGGLRPSAAPIAAGAGVGLGTLILLLGHWVTPLEGGPLLRSYADPVWGTAVPTACAGETGPHIRMGMTFTEDDCARMLAERHGRLFRALGACVTAPVLPREALALASLADNVGVGAVCRSETVRMINRGVPGSEWCKRIELYVYAGDRDCRTDRSCIGITQHRRPAERALCEGRIAPPKAG